MSLLAATALAAAVAMAPAAEASRVRQTVLAMTTNLDLRRFDTVAVAFADRVVIDYTSLWGGEPQTFTPDELMAAWKSVVLGFDTTWHELSDIQVKVAGDSATATANVDGRHWIGERTWRPIGRYDFRLARQDGAWRVTHMTLTVTDEQGERALVDLARSRAAAR